MTRRKAKPEEVPAKRRASDYSPDEREAIIEHVCNEIAKKRSLYRILEEDAGMPDYSTVMLWQRESETVSESIAHAREAALEAMIEEIVEISDDATGDPIIKYDKNGKPYAHIDGDSVQRAKLRVHARERAAALLAPRRFGTQRMDVTSDGKAISNETNVTLIENRVASILMTANRRIEEQRQLRLIMGEIDEG